MTRTPSKADNANLHNQIVNLVFLSSVCWEPLTRSPLQAWKPGKWMTLGYKCQGAGTVGKQSKGASSLRGSSEERCLNFLEGTVRQTSLLHCQLPSSLYPSEFVSFNWDKTPHSWTGDILSDRVPAWHTGGLKFHSQNYSETNTLNSASRSQGMAPDPSTPLHLTSLNP